MIEPIGTFCPVCGRDQGEEITHMMGDICPCCGIEYLDFIKEDFIAFRKDWIASGYAWRSPSMRPPNWDPVEQMKNIPERFWE